MAGNDARSGTWLAIFVVGMACFLVAIIGGIANLGDSQGSASAFVGDTADGNERPSHTNTNPNYTFPFGQAIALEIEDDALAQLQRRRDKALVTGILQEDDSSWVKAKLHEGQRTWPAKVRLKGDWTDHLEGEKWSFRVELKDNGAWRGMTVFSLQSPERCGHLSEWLYHQILLGESLLTPRYDFVRLQLNGRSLGTYAVQEHFTQQLLMHQQRLPGPILKLDEAGMWDARVASLQDPAFPYLETPFFQAASVLPFKPKSLLQDSLLSAQLQNALRLMRQYLADAGEPQHVFDIGRAARQYALADLLGTYHSLIWHNRRYYFNPVTQLLEPVVFDGFNGVLQDIYIAQPFWGYALHGHSRDDADYRDVSSVYLFQDSSFVRAYYHALARYTAPAYLDSVLQALAPAIDARTQFLKSEYWDYRLDLRSLRARAASIRTVLRTGLRADRVVVRSFALGDGRRFVTVRNHNPMPIEAFVGIREAIYLEADAGQGGQREARFWLSRGEQVAWRGLGE